MKKRKEPSRQEEVALSLKIEQRNVTITIAHAEQLFKMFTTSKSGPDFWEKQE